MPECGSWVKKYGTRKGVQRYRCLFCATMFQSPRRKKKKQGKLWKEYVWGKQSLSDLKRGTGRSHVWVRKQLDTVAVSLSGIAPHPVVACADTTFGAVIWSMRLSHTK